MRADLILTNGNVITMDDERPRAGAVAVWRGLIVAVGDEAEARRYEGPGTRRIDLAGQTVLPGLIEGHAHPCAYGQALRELDLRAAIAPSIAAIWQAVAATRATRAPISRVRRLPPTLVCPPTLHLSLRATIRRVGANGRTEGQRWRTRGGW